MDSVRPLYIWADGHEVDLAPIKVAKAELAVDYRVVPVFLTQAPRLWADRVLAIGYLPPWVCDYALTSERTGAEGWKRALAWVLHETEDDPKATLVVDVLSAALGGEAKELSPERLESERALREYSEGY